MFTLDHSIDASQFPDPHTQLTFTVTVHPQSTFIVTNAPAHLLVNKAIPGGITLTVSDMPINPILSVGQNLGLIAPAPVPLLLSLTTNSPDGVDASVVLPVTQSLSFKYSASSTLPSASFAFTAPSSAMTLFINFAYDLSIDGANIMQFILPSPIKIVINPLGSWQMNVPSSMYGGSSTVVSLLPSTVPAPDGIFITVSMGCSWVQGSTPAGWPQTPACGTVTSTVFSFSTYQWCCCHSTVLHCCCTPNLVSTAPCACYTFL